MKKHKLHSQEELAAKVAEIIYCLHYGLHHAAHLLLDDIKHQSIHLTGPIQGEVLLFAQMVDFQYAYEPQYATDPWPFDRFHPISREALFAADNLLHSLTRKAS